MLTVIFAFVRRAAAAAAPHLARTATAYGFYVLAKELIRGLVEGLGRAVIESVSGSPYVIVTMTFLVFMYAASFLSKQSLLNRKVSAAIVCMFLITLASSKTVMREVKQNIYTSKFMCARSFTKGERNLKQVYRDNNVYTGCDKNKFALALLKAATPEELELFKAVINEGCGYFSSPFNTKQLTHHCIVYADADTFIFLKRKGLLELNDPIQCASKTFAQRDRFMNAYDLARSEGNKPVQRHIQEINKLAGDGLLVRSKQVIKGFFSHNKT